MFTHSIHCTRCVRFATEEAGVQDLGVTGRGGMAEIGTYVSKLLTSELSGNVIDLCPVGVLTSKPFAFTARAWELRTAESIDVTDGLGSNIRVDTRGTEVMRIVPRLHEGVNEEWISDKARFSYDGLKRQRLDTPMVRDDHGKLKPATWAAALEAVASKLKETDPAAVKAVAGKLSDAESIVALKDLMNGIGAGNTAAEGMEGVSADARSAYLFNSNIVGVEDADVVLLIGTDPRVEAPVLNARLRRANVAGGAHVASIGPHGDLTYPVEKLGESASAVEALASGKHAFAAKLKEAKNPLVIVGASISQYPHYHNYYMIAFLANMAWLCAAVGWMSAASLWNPFLPEGPPLGLPTATLHPGRTPGRPAREEEDAPETEWRPHEGWGGDTPMPAGDVKSIGGALEAAAPATDASPPPSTQGSSRLQVRPRARARGLAWREGPPRCERPTRPVTGRKGAGRMTRRRLRLTRRRRLTRKSVPTLSRRRRRARSTSRPSRRISSTTSRRSVLSDWRR